MATTISFKPKNITKKLLAVVSDRSREVLIGRYGLGTSTKKETLEAIGKKYSITRERVRQIENHALDQIRKSENYGDIDAVFAELVGVVEDMGGIISEKELLAELSAKTDIQNHIHFLLVLGSAFYRSKEDSDFVHRWHVNSTVADQVQTALSKIYTGLSRDDLVPEAEMVRLFIDQLQDVDEKYQQDAIARRWLGLSKKLARNPLGEWGKASSPSVRVKGMRDLAYLTLKRHGSPMHFGEVARAIEELFNRKAHEATCHNELIKDDRFVLVGRGLYALAEWGYAEGVVRDVIRETLKKEGPLDRSAIIDRVKRERYVKDNTILVNLQDPQWFKKGADGRYSLK